MGILDGIVEWIAEQVMAGLDLVTTSVLGALGCDMAVFLRYFPAAETMYSVFVALAIGIILLNWVWQLFINFGLGAGVEAEDPVKLSIRSVIFILLTLFSDEIVNIVLTIGGTPYHWIMESDRPALSFADFNSVMLVIIGVCANGAVALITLILVLILAWNYLKLLFEAATGGFQLCVKHSDNVFCDGRKFFLNYLAFFFQFSDFFAILVSFLIVCRNLCSGSSNIFLKVRDVFFNFCDFLFFLMEFGFLLVNFFLKAGDIFFNGRNSYFKRGDFFFYSTCL